PHGPLEPPYDAVPRPPRGSLLERVERGHGWPASLQSPSPNSATPRISRADQATGSGREVPEGPGPSRGPSVPLRPPRVSIPPLPRSQCSRRQRGSQLERGPPHWFDGTEWVR